MNEIELKITLEPADAARLRRHPVLTELRVEPRQIQKLVSIYVDTEQHALARAGIALRVRRIGRRWVQTVKSKRTAGGAGLFIQEEIEIPAPGGHLVLDGPDPSGVFAAIAEAAGDAPLAKVFETRIERLRERLHLSSGSLIEFALDRGEVVAGSTRTPVLEAELELIEGDVAGIFVLARRLFPTGPVRFATANKAALGYRLARDGERATVDVAQPAPRTAGKLHYDHTATVETVARDVLRDCFSQISANLVMVAASDDIEGPHQLRVGLRRLRTAISVFGASLGVEAIAPVADAAREMGRDVGRLRDIDVLIEEVVLPTAALGLDDAAGAGLIAALEDRRTKLRDEVRALLAGPRYGGFAFDLLELIEARGWLVPADYSQTERLARPIGAIAQGLVKKRRRKALKLGKRIETLDADGLHALRKELKKLRYTIEILAPNFPGKQLAAFLKSLKALQDTFGSLNDATMAVESLTGPHAPARADPQAQRGAGWILGALSVRVSHDRPALVARWRDFKRLQPFWT